MSFLKIFKLFVVSLSLGMLNGCTTTTAGGAVGSSRLQLMLISSEKLDQMSAESYTNLIADATGKGTLNRDPADA